MKELIEIQNELKAPKSKHSNFGNFNYRSAENILEAVKPLCRKYGCMLTLSDTIKQIGERYYIESTAIIRSENGEAVSVTALAREPDNKKGMDAAQVTGTSSSYARKYALNGMFCIDDNKDPDTDEYHGVPDDKQQQKKQKKTAKQASTNNEIDEIKEYEARHDTPEDRQALIHRVKEREIMRGKVLDKAKELNISARELAKDYNLTQETTAEEFKKILNDLEGK